MKLNITTSKLLNFSKQSVSYQNIHKDEIIKLFREFWKNNPSEELFGDIMYGLVIFPEMLYIMCKEKQSIIYPEDDIL